MRRIAFAICLLWMPVLTMHGAVEGPHQEARDLWDKMVLAKGVMGSPVRTFVLFLKATSGSAFQNDHAGTERRTIVSSPPSGWWIFDDFRPGKLGASVRVFDLTSEQAWIGYVDNGNRPQSTNPNTPGEQQSREMILAAFFCQVPGFAPKLIEARRRVQKGLHTYDVTSPPSWRL